MSELAVVVLAHGDPIHLHRLVGALDDVPVFLHCDARTSGAVFREMASGLPERVTLVPRIPTTLASWSLVEAELRALRLALDRSSARHVAVLTGSDYPLMSMSALVEELGAWQGVSYFWNAPLPFHQWNTPRHRDGGRWRVEHRFLTRQNQVLFVRGIPLRLPLVRPVPVGLELRAASQWKIYCRTDAEVLLAAVRARPDLVRFWRTTLVPEELFAASMLASSAVTGADGLQPCAAQPWYTSWPTGVAHHPRWLTIEDLPALRAAARGPSTGPWGRREAGSPGRKLFARKFSSQIDTDVLDRIDAELRS